MASILDKYGIKEVCDVTFYEIDKTTKLPSHPVLYLDTLKVSTMEQTGEEAELRGGKGNAPLIIWDYNKDITITLEDALFSAKSMAIMFGEGPDSLVEFTSKTDSTESDANDANYIMKTEQFTVRNAGTNTGVTSSTDWTSFGWESSFRGPDGKIYAKINPKFYTADGKSFGVTGVADGSTVAGVKDGMEVFCTYDLAVTGSVIEISANSFPGTYYVTGDTYARSQSTGKDEFFQLIIPKAKVMSENTITMEAEGDPSVFNMSLRVLRGDTGELMKLVKYDLINGATASNEDESLKLIHNHTLKSTYVHNVASGASVG